MLLLFLQLIKEKGPEYYSIQVILMRKHHLAWIIKIINQCYKRYKPSCCYSCNSNFINTFPDFFLFWIFIDHHYFDGFVLLSSLFSILRAILLIMPVRDFVSKKFYWAIIKIILLLIVAIEESNQLNIWRWQQWKSERNRKITAMNDKIFLSYIPFYCPFEDEGPVWQSFY